MVCRICGKEFDRLEFTGDCKDICSSECFSVNFWREIVEEKDEHVFINGESYSIGPEESRSSFRGHAGRKFKIRFFDDGRVVETTNLWCQGKIPENFLSELPDTAEFVK